MTKGNYILFGVVIFLLAFSVVKVSGYTWNIGEPRKVLYLAPGESVEKYVLTMNSNNVSLNVSIFVEGDLVKNLKILNETNYVLAANESRRVYYTITAPNEENTTETKIDVKYTPPSGPGMVLPATVIVVTSEEYRNNTAGALGNDYRRKGNGDLLFFILIGALVVLIIAVAVFYSVRSRKKSVGRAREN